MTFNNARKFSDDAWLLSFKNVVVGFTILFWIEAKYEGAPSVNADACTIECCREGETVSMREGLCPPAQQEEASNRNRP